MSYHLGFFNNTIIIQVRYITINRKEAARTVYNVVLVFRIRTLVKALVLGTHDGKRNPLYPTLSFFLLFEW
jgi:hypothetical protein